MDLLLTDTTQGFSEMSTRLDFSKSALNKQDASLKPLYYMFYNEYLKDVIVVPAVEKGIAPIPFELDFETDFFPEFDILYASATPYAYATLAAIFLIFFNFLFKLTAAPFHF